MAKIKLERAKCIGCGSCAAICANCFEIIDDGKSHIKDASVQEVEEKELANADCAQPAADACPVQCIHVEK